MRLSLHTRFRLFVWTLILLATLDGVVGLWAAIHFMHTMEAVVAENVASLQAAEEVEIALLQQRGYVSLYVVDQGNPAWLMELEAREPAFEEWLQRVRDTAFTADEREIVARLDESYRTYRDTRHKVIELYQSGDTQAATAMLLHRMPDEFNRTYNRCEDLIDANMKSIDAAGAKNQHTVRLLTLTMTLFVLITLLAGGLASWYFSRSIARPMRQMAVAVQSYEEAVNGRLIDLEKGDLELSRIGQFLRHLMSDVVSVRSDLEQSQLQLEFADKLASVGKLAASVAHEIRNPLTSVKMWLFSLRHALRGDPSAETKLNLVADEIGRVEAIVHDFLEFSRPPAVELSRQSAGAIVSKTIELVSHRMRELGVVVESDLPPELPEVMADADQLRQVLLNLLINAADACDEKGRVTLQAMPAEDGGRWYVLIRVTDNGTGIAAEAAERIFEPFFTTKSDGPGLGLSIAASIMHRHQGRITLEHTSENGTTFAVWIPAVERNADGYDSDRG